MTTACLPLTMPGAIAFIKWDSFCGTDKQPALFSADPLTFNSRQPALHRLRIGTRLWLVSRRPSDQQYYFLAAMHVAEHRRNPPGSPLAQEHGEYSIIAHPQLSLDLGTTFPAEALLRALQFDSGKPIRYGASIGQSLQAIRTLTAADSTLLDSALERTLRNRTQFIDAPAGLWTKCAAEFAEYFTVNWATQGKPLAFMLYDSPPALPHGAPIFIHSDKSLRLLARVVGTQFVSGHRFTVDEAERLAERERIWSTFRESTVHPPARAEYEKFFSGQHGVRSLLLMDRVSTVAEPLPFKVYGRALEWGYPSGVGYRYLTLSQCILLLRALNIETDTKSHFEAYLAGLAAGNLPRSPAVP